MNSLMNAFYYKHKPRNKNVGYQTNVNICISYIQLLPLLLQPYVPSNLCVWNCPALNRIADLTKSPAKMLCLFSLRHSLNEFKHQWFDIQPKVTKEVANKKLLAK